MPDNLAYGQPRPDVPTGNMAVGVPEGLGSDEEYMMYLLQIYDELKRIFEPESVEPMAGPPMYDVPPMPTPPGPDAMEELRERYAQPRYHERRVFRHGTMEPVEQPTPRELQNYQLLKQPWI